MNLPSPRNSEAGLTLIELVVVAVLVAFLSAALYGSLSGIIRTRELSDELRKTDRTAHYLFGRLGLELAGRGFVPLNTADPDDPNKQPAPGALPTYLVGTEKKEGENDEDSIRFVSANAAQSFVGAPGNFGTVEVEYRLEADTDVPVGREGRRMLLVREETPAAVATGDTLKKRRVTIPVAEDLVSLNFRYLKGGKWQDGWKETNPPFPEAIEVTIVIRGDNGRVETYRTAFAVSQKQRAPKSQ